jgi:hypothetical protein
VQVRVLFSSVNYITYHTSRRQKIVLLSLNLLSHVLNVKAQGGVEFYLVSYVTLAPDEGELLASHPGRFISDAIPQ